MSDEGFHEIQLNGKQLVFLFMAATVVSVVIFLCGVMVGRGVRAQQSGVSAAELPAATQEPAAPESASTPANSDSRPPVPVGGGEGSGTSPEPAEDDYYEQLTDERPSDAKATPPPDVPVVSKDATPARQPARDERPPTKREAQPPSAVTSGGFAVQIAALRDRAEADAIVKRLASKGYQAYVVNPVAGKPPVYRVQVGRFPDRGEADRIAARLKTEEQFSPWVTR
jgi:cell division septation protein DedD